jgi:uncharacterized membrane protein
MHICFTYLVLEQLTNKTIHCTVGAIAFTAETICWHQFSILQTGVSLGHIKRLEDLCRYAVEPSR